MQEVTQYRTNRDLFSNYYLDEHLPETEEWDQVDQEALREARQEILELWDQERDTVEKTNESQLERRFIRPMFDKLGIPFEVEESVSRTQRRPDYAFFETDEAARNAFDRREEGGDFYDNAVAVADAKRWDRPLDTRGSGEHQRDFENPSYQIHVYLQETPVRWAILTNGKKWRLYYGPTSHRLDSYYEIDLPTILEDGDLEDFKYFYLFFRHDAFVEDARGDAFLDDVYDESNVFARELGEDLQNNIYDAIKVLSEGFLQYPENDLSEDDLKLIHDSSLIYLYRLIFVLYAEAEGRDLLDTDNEIYEASYSLNALKQEIVEERDSAASKYRDWQTDLWLRLDELFRLIDQGSKSRGIPEDDLHIPAYNGGLFRTSPDEDDSAEAQFLDEHEVGDAYLAEVIDLLARSRNGNGGGKIFVDYSSLDVRHLGSIYEGLLEYQLNVADEPLALDDGEYVPADEGDAVVVEAGDIYLTTGGGERKATGSYYTPEYVVEYIVDNTLGPLVDDIRNDLAGQDAYDDGGFAAEFADRVFELKVLDPAMGSGHFLTSAVDYLAREIIDAQEKQAAQQGIETVDEEHDINWARRQVAQRCIYGVDLNPLAVELAKVSLWLRTLAAEQPLAFLDHHLKTGNSLVGSDIETVLENGSGEPDSNEGQLTLAQSFDRTRRKALDHVTDRFQDLLAIDNETLDDIKEMEAVFEEVRDEPLYGYLLAMANVHTAEKFGLDVPHDAYERMAAALRDDSWEHVEGEGWFQEAQAMAADVRFFHWELEFPVVFYGEDGDRGENEGFDAVIGNPPYFRLSVLDDFHNNGLSELFPEIYQGGGDILYFFLSKGIDVSRNGGKLGYIIARYFLESTSAENAREYIRRTCHVSNLVDFGGMQPFESVSIQAIIPILTVGGSSSQPTNVIRITNNDAKYTQVEAALAEDTTALFERYESKIVPQGENNSWTFHRLEVRKIIDEMRNGSVSLEEIAEVAQSMQSGRSGVLVVSPDEVEEHQIEQELLKPIVKSGDVRRYYLEENNDRLIWTEGVDIDQYPGTKEYLAPHEDDLASRYDIQSRGVPWWYISNPRNAELFENIIPRILTPYMSPRNRFFLDREGFYNDGGDLRGIFIQDDSQYNHGYLTALLNSTAGEFYHHKNSKRKDAGKYEYFGNVLNGFPVPEIDFNQTTSTSVDELKQIYHACLGDDKPFEDQEPMVVALNNPKTKSVHDFLSYLVDEMISLCDKYRSINLSLPDYLGSYTQGHQIDELDGFQPAKGVSESILVETTQNYEKLQVSRVNIERHGNEIIIQLEARYKPEDPSDHQIDQYGYTYTKPKPAIRLVELDELTADLIASFVIYVVNQADDGTAGFHKSATKTISLFDRLKQLALPRKSDIEKGLQQYLEAKNRAADIEQRVRRTDDLIDSLVNALYGFTNKQVEVMIDNHEYGQDEFELRL